MRVPRAEVAAWEWRRKWLCHCCGPSWGWIYLCSWWCLRGGRSFSKEINGFGELCCAECHRCSSETSSWGNQISGFVGLGRVQNWLGTSSKEKFCLKINFMVWLQLSCLSKREKGEREKPLSYCQEWIFLTFSNENCFERIKEFFCFHSTKKWGTS